MLKPPSAFRPAVEPERVDKYLDQLRNALQDTNEKFVRLQIAYRLLLLAHYLFLKTEHGEISFGGIKVSDLALVTK
jgi:hypothetical protein